jgi:hypothetical protein
MKRLTSPLMPCSPVASTGIGINPRDGVTVARLF